LCVVQRLAVAVGKVRSFGDGDKRSVLVGVQAEGAAALVLAFTLPIYQAECERIPAVGLLARRPSAGSVGHNSLCFSFGQCGVPPEKDCNPMGQRGGSYKGGYVTRAFSLPVISATFRGRTRCKLGTGRRTHK
jgi:hypothetical protein